MNRAAKAWIVVPGLVVALVLGLGAARQTLSPWRWVAQWARSPFQLATSAAPVGPVVVERVQRLGRLETCRYQEQVVLRGDTKGWLPTWIAGDQLLLVGRGEVVAGVDLARLRPEDILAEADRVTVRLPASEVFHTRLDNRQSEVVDRRSGLFTGPDRALETRVRLEAEDRIREAAVAGGILATADANARAVLRDQLAALGFSTIRFL
jgi:hypothetical protein